mmetsp:Transcript_435/g.1048  ORF Transcript_435/g.1048 Transcript_435/m.1048 type:complete len:427 (-) Transcript_435:393-1673(-)
MVVGRSSITNVRVPLATNIPFWTTISWETDTSIIVVACLPSIGTGNGILIGTVQLKVGVKNVGRLTVPVIQEQVEEVHLAFCFAKLWDGSETLVVDVTMCFTGAAIAETTNEARTINISIIFTSSIDQGTKLSISCLGINLGRKETNTFSSDKLPAISFSNGLVLGGVSASNQELLVIQVGSQVSGTSSIANEMHINGIGKRGMSGLDVSCQICFSTVSVSHIHNIGSSHLTRLGIMSEGECNVSSGSSTTISLFNDWHLLNATTEWSSWYRLDVSLVSSVAKTDVVQGISLEKIGISSVFPSEANTVSRRFSIGEDRPSVLDVVGFGRVEQVMTADVGSTIFCCKSSIGDIINEATHDSVEITRVDNVKVGRIAVIAELGILFRRQLLCVVSHKSSILRPSDESVSTRVGIKTKDTTSFHAERLG